jgi:hypothetical protein
MGSDHLWMSINSAGILVVLSIKLFDILRQRRIEKAHVRLEAEVLELLKINKEVAVLAREYLEMTEEKKAKSRQIFRQEVLGGVKDSVREGMQEGVTSLSATDGDLPIPAVVVTANPLPAKATDG